ncbi:ABC transporter permease [Brachybacterium sacelli]|uniref:Peptide/nickel transport system permease protein n=1 Tax=Brachybacterium sacelli TaxID=173364 RepID=A0ABS4X5G9_9MICO|nr:ABC transporter permease [Brachybacterium sacelli]MBP2383611.1 peptide/nickel transport system permease protein [Brachybacterium sacelli]
MRFLLRKLGLYAFIAWAALTLNFLIPRLMPGDPVSILIAGSKGQIDAEARDAIAAQFGLSDDPLPLQYVHYLGDLLHLDLGVSLSQYPVPVMDIIGQSLPWTVGLVGVSTVIGFVLGTGLGVILAWRRGTWSDHVLPGLTFLNAIPYFWMALILVMLLSVTVSIFPAGGGYDRSIFPEPTAQFAGSVLYHAALPALTIVIGSFAGWVLQMRNMTVTILGEDYVSMAEAKGLPPRTVLFGYAARNAILPSVTGFALALGAVVGGSMLTEVIFNYPGLGYALFQAVSAQDFPLMQGLFLIISLAVIAANLIADIAYVFLDPRTRQGA